MKRSGPPKRRKRLNRGLSGLDRRSALRSRSDKRRRKEEDAKAIRREVIVAAGGACMIRPILQAECHDWLNDQDRHEPDCPTWADRSAGCPCPDLDAVVRAAHSCWKAGQACHERRKRSAGGSLVNPANLIPCCHACNDWVECNPAIAHRLGLVVRPGDPEYNELGADR